MALFSNKFEVKGKLGVISGASQGLGLALAKQLYSQGASLIIISRDDNKLKYACESIRKNACDGVKQFVEYMAADLRDYKSSSAVLPLLGKLGIEKIDFLFCCAGSAHPRYFLNMTHEDLEFGLQTNYITCVNLVHLLVKRMIDTEALESCSKQDSAIDDFKKAFRIGAKEPRIRHIVLVSSVVAFYNFIGYAEYGPSKAAIKSFGDSIRQELRPYNVDVHVVFPGNFSSEGYAVENKTKPEACKVIEGSSKPISVDKCAGIIIKGLQHGYMYIFTDFIGWVLESFSLGLDPRQWGIVQVFLALIGSIIGGVVDQIHQVYIQGYFRKEGGFITDEKVSKEKADDTEDAEN